MAGEILQTQPAGRALWAADLVFVGASALVFLAGAAGTWSWLASQTLAMPPSAAMPGAAMPPAPWMGLPGQSWLGAGAGFMGMWLVMMLAMMLPSLVPELWRYRRSITALSSLRLGGLTALAAAGYFAVWMVFGAGAYVLGTALAGLAMAAMAPANWLAAASGAVVLVAGGFQLTRWKSRRLECCREAPANTSLPAEARGAWRFGLRLGAECTACCLGFMLFLLVTGMMSLAALIIVALAITLERLAPRPVLMARVAGVGLLAAGLVLVARAAGVL